MIGGRIIFNTRCWIIRYGEDSKALYPGDQFYLCLKNTNELVEFGGNDTLRFGEFELNLEKCRMYPVIVKEELLIPF